MALRSRRKSIRDQTGGKTLVSRAAKQQGVPALERINDEMCRVGLEKAVFLIKPKIKLYTTFNFGEPIHS